MNFVSVNLVDPIYFTVSPPEVFVRGTLMFWFLFLIFRLILQRDIGSVSITDFLFAVILGDAVQNSMIGDGYSVSDGAMLISTLVFWNFTLDWLSYRFPFLDRLISARKLCLVRDGKLQRRNMRKEFITVEEIYEKFARRD